MTAPSVAEPRLRLATVVSRNSFMRLPADLKDHLRELPPHVRALHGLVEAIDEDAYARAAAGASPAALTGAIYPLERAVEILDGHLCALAAIAVREAGLPPCTAEEAIEWLPALGLTTRARAHSLLEIHSVTTALDHERDPREQRLLVRAALVLDREILAFLGEYTRRLVVRAPRRPRRAPWVRCFRGCRRA